MPTSRRSSSSSFRRLWLPTKARRPSRTIARTCSRLPGNSRALKPAFSHFFSRHAQDPDRHAAFCLALRAAPASGRRSPAGRRCRGWSGRACRNRSSRRRAFSGLTTRSRTSGLKSVRFASDSNRRRSSFTTRRDRTCTPKLRLRMSCAGVVEPEDVGALAIDRQHLAVIAHQVVVGAADRHPRLEHALFELAQRRFAASVGVARSARAPPRRASRPPASSFSSSSRSNRKMTMSMVFLARRTAASSGRVPASGCVISFTRRFPPPRSQADFVLDLGMPRMSAGAAMAPCDRDVAFDDALGRHLFAGPA